jgi:hypothetical protein
MSRNVLIILLMLLNAVATPDLVAQEVVQATIIADVAVSIEVGQDPNYVQLKLQDQQVSLRSRDAKQDIPVNSFALDHRQPIVPRPSRSPALRHSIASSLLSSAPAPEMTGRPGRWRSVDTLWRYARRVSSIALRASGDYRPSCSLSMAGSEG